MGPHRSGSFSYKVIHEDIVKTLDNRAQMDNTVQIAMPFIKATTTLQLDEVLGVGSKGFTLGLHAIDKDVKYQDMFSEQDSDMPLIGYTYTPTGTKLVYAKDRADEYANAISRVFDLRTSLLTVPDEKKFTRIPPPGISQVNIGTAKNGLLSSATMQVQVPSLIQLEALHRTFLVPGLGMVLEWGQQYASETPLNDYGEPVDITQYMFPWHNMDELDKMLEHLAKKEVGLMDILEKYTYKAQGQYSWMFGRVANFSTKANSDGSFDCSVKIVGPSEDSWAYATKNTVVPRKDKASFYCAEKTNSVYSYFAESTPQGPLNFKSLLDDAANNKVPGWEGHVRIMRQDPNTAGEPTKDEKRPNEDKKTFADSEDAYFLSWRFFVNVVLNDPVRGIKKIFNDALPDEVDNVSLLLPYATGENRENRNVGQIKYLDDPIEPYVGMNEHLRSVDPSTLLIINEKAVQLAQKNPQYNMGTSDRDFFTLTNTAEFFRDSVVGLFEEASGQEDRGLLSSGVWLNHKAVVLSMIGADTILRGVSNLLERMNQATLNYWQLTIDVTEGSMEQKRTNNYSVVDANFRESAEDAVRDFLDKVYMFNKYVRVDNETGKLVGSELIDCVVDLSLPKRLFSQIATLGLVQPETLHNAGITSGSTEDGPDYTDLKSPKIDTNDTLREMFAITVLSVKGDDKQGPDLTILPKVKRDAAVAANALCGKANTQVPSGVGGVGNRPNDNNPTASTNNVAKQETEKLKQEAEAKLNSDQCKQCLTCPPPKETNTETQQTNKKLSELTLARIRELQRAGRVLAVGKYQGIGRTLQSWIDARSIPLNAIFDANLQEQFGDWLAVPVLTPYFKGNSNASLEATQRRLAGIWAAMPLPGPRDQQISNYEGDKAGNRAGVTSGQFQDVLVDAKAKYNRGSSDTAFRVVKDFIGQYESGNSYDAINRGYGGDTPLYKEAYYKALNGYFSPNSVNKKCTDEAYRQIANASQQPTPQSSPAPVIDKSGFCYGDSIAVGYCRNVNGRKEQSRPPKIILGWLRSDIQQLKGKKLTLSTGVSNDRTDFASIEEQFKLLKENDVTVTVIGAAQGRYDAENVRLGQLASQYGFKFLGPFVPGSDGVHPTTYQTYVSPTTPSNSTNTNTAPPPITQPGTGAFGLPQNNLPDPLQRGKDICKECERYKQVLDQANARLNEISTQEQINSTEDAIIKKFYGLQDAFRYIEVFPEYMVAQITDSANGNMANAFGTSPGSLSIYADMTLPGISGIRVGELFWIDRMPVFYKAFGAFQVMSIEDVIGIDGWKTKIHARFNFLGKKWKEAMATKLNEARK